MPVPGNIIHRLLLIIFEHPVHTYVHIGMYVIYVPLCAVLVTTGSLRCLLIIFSLTDATHISQDSPLAHYTIPACSHLLVLILCPPPMFDIPYAIYVYDVTKIEPLLGCVWCGAMVRILCNVIDRIPLTSLR